MASILNATTSSGLVTSADNSGSLQLATNNGTTAVTIDTSQRVGVGVTSPGNKLVLPNNQYLAFQNSTGGETAYIGMTSGNLLNFSDKMAITSGGVVQVGNNNGTGEVFAQNTVKVWGVIQAGATAFYNSFGTSSISKISTGVFQINFSRTLGSSRFGCGLSQYSAGYSFINNETTTLCRVNTTNTSNSAVDADVQFLIAGSS